MAKFWEQIISNFFENEEENRQEENQVTEISECQGNLDKPVELSDVVNFVRELEAYYTNDIFKVKSNYMTSAFSDDEVIFYKKKIKEYETASILIKEIKEKLLNIIQENTELWGKASYSFYSELEAVSLKNTYKEAYEIVKQLISINAISELDEIIRRRVESYRDSWQITDTEILRNRNLRILERKGNIETYQFGDFKKDVIDEGIANELLPKQMIALQNIDMDILFGQPDTDNIWIRCVTISRQQLEFLKKSTVFQNNWESEMKNEIVYDIVACDNMKYYIRAILQLLLPRDNYVLISVINPNHEMYCKLNNTVEVDSLNRKVKVIDKMAFILPERTGIYKDNLQIACISRKSDLKKISFIPYKDFVENFF